jgi:hypothetical protein
MARQGSKMEWCLVRRSLAQWHNTPPKLYELFQHGIPDDLLASNVFKLEPYTPEHFAGNDAAMKNLAVHFTEPRQIEEFLRASSGDYIAPFIRHVVTDNVQHIVLELGFNWDDCIGLIDKLDRKETGLNLAGQGNIGQGCAQDRISQSSVE